MQSRNRTNNRQFVDVAPGRYPYLTGRYVCLLKRIHDKVSVLNPERYYYYYYIITHLLL